MRCIFQDYRLYCKAFCKIGPFLGTNIDAKNSFTTRLGIPIGFTLRLAKTKPVLKNIQFFFESKPGVAITFVSGYKSFVRPWFTAGGGIKILFY